MWIRRALVVAALTGGGMLVAVPAASANDCGGFCGYDNPDFSDRILFSRAGPGARVDVADDQINSGDNETSSLWEGRNRRRWYPDQVVFRWNGGDEASDLGDVSNKIDHFNVR